MIRKIALYYRTESDCVRETLLSAARLLVKAGFRLFAEPGASEIFSHEPVEFLEQSRLFSECDLVLCFGGDGTLLSAARLAGEFSTPVLGVNLGHIGFLSALERQDLSLLKDLNRTDRFFVEERMMLKITCGDRCYHALNEACIVSESALGVLSFDVSVDDTLIGHYRADGLIVASPTGSTAYSLSAGGPIIDPRISCLCITPICAHSLLRAQALIEPPEARVTLSDISGKDRSVLCIDGEKVLELTPDSRVLIEKSERVTRLMRKTDRHFCHVLYQKLNERDEL